MDDKRSLGEYDNGHIHRVSEGISWRSGARFMWSRRKRARRLWDKLPERLQDILTARGIAADDLLESRWRDLQRIPGVGPVYAQKIMEAKDG